MNNNKNTTQIAKEREKYEIIKSTIAGEYTNQEASERLKITIRQVRRLKRVVEEFGETGLVHKLKGKPSNQRIAKQTEQTVVTFLKKPDHHDFGPTFATEKLAEKQNIIISEETVRRIMTEAGLWKPSGRKAKQPHRQWREPMARYGELVQYDGSYHDWNEDSEEECLLQAIDDATGQITLTFDDHEGIIPTFRFWWSYFERYGLPMAIYLDKFSTYKINHKCAEDNKDLLSQFERAMKELDVRVIHAHSPEAKGRVERGFGTHQDRLIKELRLAKKKTRDDMNRFLTEVYITKHNQRFGREPRLPKDAHRALTKQQQKQLPSIFSIQHTRVVKNDFTIQFQNQWFQLTEKQPTTVYKKDIVTIEERLDNSIHLRHPNNDVYLSYEQITTRSKPTPKKTVLERRAYTHKPAKDHPWRR